MATKLEFKSVIDAIPALTKCEFKLLITEMVAVLSHGIIPDLAQRKLMDILKPGIFDLRSKGCSFEQIATLLTQIGLKLQPGTVATYFNEFLCEKFDHHEMQMAATVRQMIHRRENMPENHEIDNIYEAVLGDLADAQMDAQKVDIEGTVQSFIQSTLEQKLKT